VPKIEIKKCSYTVVPDTSLFSI